MNALRRTRTIYHCCRRGGALPLPRRTNHQKRTNPGAFVPRRRGFPYAHLPTAGRGRTPPLRSRGKLYGFALMHPDLPVRTAQSFRHGCAVPPPFTQGRLWCVPFRIGEQKPAAPYRAGGASPAPTLRRNALQLRNKNPSPHQSASPTASPQGEALGACLLI